MNRFTQALLLCLLLSVGREAVAAPDGMLSGNLSSVGSDTLANLMALWGQDFSRHYPNVNLQLQAAGSSTAPTALAAGAAQLGPMSRPMKAAEVSAFEHRYGYAPLAVPVAVDALVVLVHQDNPLRGLNLQQLDQIFSATRRCGENTPINRWGELGLQGGWQQRALQRFGRNSASGTYGYFKLRALCGGDFMARVNELPGSASVVQAVAGSLNGIGYASIGFRASGVRLLPLAETGDRYIEPSETNVRNGSYPLARYLYIYINKAPNQPLEPLTAAFLDRVLSAQGQDLVNHDGYLPLPPDTLRKTRALLGLE
ncbi:MULTISPECIES: PstS family phosphate ABC transporter substrate-binding protein [Serratia]|uniref:Phosphate-binding protein n=1 Tax=Serratia fonticola TaxID=47917 RepID=A0AAW3WQ67_SERFO|nr:phosphate ABC transporter substrate-binding protein PstS family protein [Serratia fonticola]MBC3211742.1 phosphate ABC transporter substrate-binding protein PstS family protein [Serratia fonticola]NYA12725.1 phosphate ABC transporter substrate-binding protein PstS family protein [Serratia fonticola]NYA32304.1 phosphate ABC transporter substrate-binding protein PstS family protein [Serratia fonticola]